MNYSDEEILIGLRERNDDVINYIENRYFSMVEYIVTSKGGDREDARDLFNDAMLAIIMKTDTPEFVLTCQFKSYLYAVCNNMYKLIRKKKRIADRHNTMSSEPEPDNDFTEDYDRKLYRQKLMECFNKLGPKCQKIYRMYWNEISQKEIAKNLGISYAYLRKRKYECRKKLIGIIKSDLTFMKLIKDEIPKILEV
jgi:RNA polymerase sigma factor (sigma-70 family)